MPSKSRGGPSVGRRARQFHMDFVDASGRLIELQERSVIHRHTFLRRSCILGQKDTSHIVNGSVPLDENPPRRRRSRPARSADQAAATMRPSASALMNPA